MPSSCIVSGPFDGTPLGTALASVLTQLNIISTNINTISTNVNTANSNILIIDSKADSIQEGVDSLREGYIGMDPIRVVRDTPSIFSPSIVSPLILAPPDTISAVGEKSIVSMTNTGVMILDKETMIPKYAGLRTSIDPLSRGDPHIVYDQFTKRFFFCQFSDLCRCDIDLNITGGIGVLCGSNIFAAPAFPAAMWGLPIVPANPLNAGTPFVNAAAVSGKIALILRGGVGAGVKIANAQAAGAVGVIFYNNVAGTSCSPVIAFGAPEHYSICGRLQQHRSCNYCCLPQRNACIYNVKSGAWALCNDWHWCIQDVRSTDHDT